MRTVGGAVACCCFMVTWRWGGDGGWNSSRIFIIIDDTEPRKWMNCDSGLIHVLVRLLLGLRSTCCLLDFLEQTLVTCSRTFQGSWSLFSWLNGRLEVYSSETVSRVALIWHFLQNGMSHPQKYHQVHLTVNKRSSTQSQHQPDYTRHIM